MSHSEDDVLDAIQRHTDLVISHITDHTGTYSTEAKIASMERYVGLVKGALKRRPPRKRRRWRWFS